MAERERWLSVSQAAAAYDTGVMWFYRRIWRGELQVSNEALDGEKPRYKIAESSIQNYFASRRMAVPSRGLST